MRILIFFLCLVSSLQAYGLARFILPNSSSLDLQGNGYPYIGYYQTPYIFGRLIALKESGESFVLFPTAMKKELVKVFGRPDIWGLEETSFLHSLWDNYQLTVSCMIWGGLNLSEEALKALRVAGEQAIPPAFPDHYNAIFHNTVLSFLPGLITISKL